MLTLLKFAFVGAVCGGAYAGLFGIIDGYASLHRLAAQAIGGGVGGTILAVVALGVRKILRRC
jgi:hypothetical protein